MAEDEVISRIREARRQISEECEHNPRKLIDYYKQLQQEHKGRMLRAETDKEEAADDLVKA